MKNRFLLLFALSISLLFANSAFAENLESASTPAPIVKSAPTAKSASVINLSDEELDILAELLAKHLASMHSNVTEPAGETTSEIALQHTSASEEEKETPGAKNHRKHRRRTEKAGSETKTSEANTQLDSVNSSKDASSDAMTQSQHSSRHKKQRGGRPAYRKRNQSSSSKSGVNSESFSAFKD